MFGDFAKCQACSLATSKASGILEANSVHNGILKLASIVCEATGAMGHRFKECPLLVKQFGEPMFTVVEDYLLSKERICNEHFGWCKNPVITALDLDTVVDGILATKSEAIQNDDYI